MLWGIREIMHIAAFVTGDLVPVFHSRLLKTFGGYDPLCRCLSYKR